MFRARIDCTIPKQTMLCVFLFLICELCWAAEPNTTVIHPTHDAYIQGGSRKDFSDSVDLVAKEKEARQTSVGLIRRSFLEFDLSSVENATNQDLQATLVLTLRGSQEGAAVRLCPSSPFSSKLPISWSSQPTYDQERSLGDVEYVNGMTTMKWNVGTYIRKELAAGNRVVAFGVLATVPHHYTTFRSIDYGDKDHWPALQIELSPTVSEIKAPYSEPKFRKVLDNSRLQWPTAKFQHPKLDKYAVESFQLTKGGYMQFTIEGEGQRCALRQNAEWGINSRKERRVKARVFLDKPNNETKELSFLEIQTRAYKTFPPGALLRIGWKRSKNGLQDHIWATLRVFPDSREVDVFPLFSRPKHVFDIQVLVSESTLTILLDGEVVPLSPELGAYDLSYWKALDTNMFLAGVFLHKVCIG